MVRCWGRLPAGGESGWRIVPLGVSDSRTGHTDTPTARRRSPAAQRSGSVNNIPSQELVCDRPVFDPAGCVRADAHSGASGLLAHAVAFTTRAPLAADRAFDRNH
jgi:hypothetical protein